MISKLIFGCVAITFCVAATFAFSSSNHTSKDQQVDSIEDCVCVCDQGVCSDDCIYIDGFCICENCICVCTEDGCVSFENYEPNRDEKTECGCSGACAGK